jgi:N-acetylmuramic acid 6-phosphate etherase
LLDAQTDLSICPDTGAEPITGSTRMKAGTAQKMILNMISTGVMVRQGKVVENLMVNVRPTNIKLKDRCIRIVRELTGAEDPASVAAMDACDWDIRTAVRALKGEK